MLPSGRSYSFFVSSLPDLDSLEALCSVYPSHPRLIQDFYSRVLLPLLPIHPVLPAVTMHNKFLLPAARLFCLTTLVSSSQ